jgi:hypothetical protein
MTSALTFIVQESSISERRQLFSFGYEPKSHTIVAPTLPGRRGSVVEHVTLMSPASNAVILRARDDELEVLLRAHVSRNGLVEARPSRTTVELRLGLEEREIAGSTDIGALSLLVKQGAGIRSFGRLFEKHPIGVFI